MACLLCLSSDVCVCVQVSDKSKMILAKAVQALSGRSMLFNVSVHGRSGLSKTSVLGLKRPGKASQYKVGW